MAFYIGVYAYAFIDHSRADQLLPELLMEQFDTFWRQMLASALNFNTYSFSVTSIFHLCQAKYYNMLHSLQVSNHISCMVSILTI